MLKFYTSLAASFVALSALAGCSAHHTSGGTASADETAAKQPTAAKPPTAASIDPAAALTQMRAAVPVAGQTKKDLLLRVDPATLPAALATRFSRAKKSLEDFAFNHSDMGDEESKIAYVLSAPNASTFVGFVVFAYGGDDADRYAAGAAAYYAPNGALLDIDSSSEGISDSENAGDFSHVDDNLLAAEEKTLRGAFTYDASKQSVAVDKTKTQSASIDQVPFASFAKSIQAEIERSTFAHTDVGNDATRFVSVNGADGKLAGYILTSEGGDDADRWFSAGYALFSAGGQLLAREISTEGLADNMGDDALVFETR